VRSGGRSAGSWTVWSSTSRTTCCGRRARGTRPGDAEARRARLAELVAQAPPLLPVYSHRYVLAAGPPLVLSVHQSDIVVYGCDLRAYLLHELHRLLGIPEEPTWMQADVQAIPFWGELMLLA
jgi:hypothetical protein